MTKKKIKQKSSVAKPRKPTPFRDVGGIVGSQLGEMFRLPMLKGVGRWLGTGIGSIFGSGDYSLVGGLPKSNILMNGAQIPQFSSTNATNIVCHREYLGDVSGTSVFTNSSYPLNPGMNQTFPWLSTIAQNYQEYKFHGLIFEFRSLVTDFVTSGAPGVVIMATNYNSDAPNYVNKQQMENSEYAVATKPTVNLIHGVECATSQTVLPQSYVRSGPVPVGIDLRTYDLGNFQLATQGNPVQLLGELWVTYCVEFFKPILFSSPGLSGHISRILAGPTVPFGQTATLATGDLTITVLPSFDTIVWPVVPGASYLVDINWKGANTTITYPTFTFTNVGLQAYYHNDSDTALFIPINGATTLYMHYEAVVKCNTTSNSVASLKLSSGGVYPATTLVDVVITLLDASAT